LGGGGGAGFENWYCRIGDLLLSNNAVLLTGGIAAGLEPSMGLQIRQQIALLKQKVCPQINILLSS
jgi:hypothetical protein